MDHALAALQHLPGSPEMIAQAIDLRCDLRNAHMPFGEHDRMVEHIDAAEPLATALDDRSRLARVLAYMGSNFFIAGKHDHAIATFERGLAVAADLDDFRLETELNFRLALVHHALGNYPRALHLHEQTIEVLTGERAYRAFAGPNLTGVVSRSYRARSLIECGRFVEAGLVAEEAVRIAEAIEHLNSLVVALSALGVLHVRRGDLGAAIPVLERDVHLCQTDEIPTMLALAAPCLGLAYALSGRRSEAMPLLEQAVEHGAKATGEHAWQTSVTGEGYLIAGRIGDAAKLADHSLRFAREGKERGSEAWALRLLGEIALRRHPPDIEQATAHYRQAIGLADELGMRPLVAHCHLGLGNLSRRTGDRAKAEEHLVGAKAMYREMGMSFWLEKAEAAPGPPHRNSP